MLLRWSRAERGCKGRVRWADYVADDDRNCWGYNIESWIAARRYLKCRAVTLSGLCAAKERGRGKRHGPA